VPHPRVSTGSTKRVAETITPRVRSDGGEYGARGAPTGGRRRRNINWPNNLPGGGLGGLGGSKQQKGNPANTNYRKVAVKKPPGGAGGKPKGTGSATKGKSAAQLAAAQKRAQAAQAAALKKAQEEQARQAKLLQAEQVLSDKIQSAIRGQELVAFQNSAAYTGGTVAEGDQIRMGMIASAQTRLANGDLEGAAAQAEAIQRQWATTQQQKMIWSFIAAQLRRLNAMH